MFETPYQTTPCSRFVMEKTFAGVRKLEINGELISATGGITGVKLVPAGVDAFQPFQQPITRLEIPSLETGVVIDGRSLLRVDGTPSKLDTYKHALLVAQLTEMWYTQGPSIKKDMLNMGDFPAKVFMNWIASAITTRLGLDFGQAALVRALTAVYYIQLYGPLTEHSNADDRDRIIVRAARVVPGLDALTLGTVLGELPILNNLQDYVNWIKARLDTPRVESLTIGFLWTALGFNFGAQYMESVAVAMEYPPVFLAMVYAAVNERSYSKSGLGRIIERLIKRDDDKEFTKNIHHLTGAR